MHAVDGWPTVSRAMANSDESGTAHAASAARLEIRPGAQDDVPTIVALLARENGRPADADAVAACLASAPSVVALLGGEIVGVIYSRQFSPDILEWRNSLVAASLRRRGVGRRLVEVMEEATVQAGFRAAIGVNCWMHRGSSAARASVARAFWLAMGFSIVFATDGSVVLAKYLSATGAAAPRWFADRAF